MITIQEWEIWTRGKGDAPREYGLKRTPIEGYNGLEKLWTGIDEYSSIFSREQIEKQEYDTIFAEVDAHKPGEDWKAKLSEVLSKTEVPSRLYVTGRGAHMYFDLVSPVNGVGRYKQVVAALVKKWGIAELIDMHVVGDVRRVARLPQSRNSHGGYMVRVPLQGWEHVIETVPVIGSEETLTHEVPQKIELVIGETKPELEQQFASVSEVKRLYDEGEYPPCIRAGIQQIQKTGELDHAQRLHTFGFLVQNGEKGKAWEILRHYAGDFNPSISQYQLDYLEKSHFQVFKCANVPRDLCPYSNQKECMFWPSINVHRRRLESQTK